MSFPESHEAGNEIQETSGCPPKEYAYQRLLQNHIRLLKFCRDSEYLQIIHTSFDYPPAYTTISYTWNGESREHGILIDGFNLNVINNIRLALPHLKTRAKTQYLWIDGICINQEDDGEKAIQVPFMREIYRRCSECLVWLGESTPEASEAFDAVPRISVHLSQYSASQVWEMEGIGIRSPRILDSPLWNGLVDIFSRPWFKRVWTFQEGVLPSEIVFLCGDKAVTFDEIEPLAMPLLHHLTALQHFYPEARLSEQFIFVGFLKTIRISRFRVSSQTSQNVLDTLKLLYFTRTWSSSHPLDRIYGVLGLTDPSLRKSLVVNYSKTSESLSRDIATWYIEQGQDLFILNLASSFRYKTCSLPSWIPNVARIGSHWCIAVIWQRFRTGMVANSTPGKRFSMQGDELYVSGICIDEVSRTTPSRTRKFGTQAQLCTDILEWEASCLLASCSLFPSNDNNIPEAHWMTMLSMCDDHLRPSLASYVLVKSFLKCIAGNEPLTSEMEARSQDLSVQIRRFHHTALMGHFFCTVDGRVGIGSKRVRVGDRICVFCNGFTPFIIRPLLDGKKHKFVSDSYTFSLMNGETFQRETQGKVNTFILV